MFKLIVTEWDHIETEDFVSIGSGDSLKPNGTKLLPESILTKHP